MYVMYVMLCYVMYEYSTGPGGFPLREENFESIGVCPVGWLFGRLVIYVCNVHVHTSTYKYKVQSTIYWALRLEYNNFQPGNRIIILEEFRGAFGVEGCPIIHSKCTPYN